MEQWFEQERAEWLLFNKTNISSELDNFLGPEFDWFHIIMKAWVKPLIPMMSSSQINMCSNTFLNPPNGHSLDGQCQQCKSSAQCGQYTIAKSRLSYDTIMAKLLYTVGIIQNYQYATSIGLGDQYMLHGFNTLFLPCVNITQICGI